MFDTAKMVFAADGKKLNFFAAWAIAQVIRERMNIVGGE